MIFVKIRDKILNMLFGVCNQRYIVCILSSGFYGDFSRALDIMTIMIHLANAGHV